MGLTLTHSPVEVVHVGDDMIVVVDDIRKHTCAVAVQKGASLLIATHREGDTIRIENVMITVVQISNARVRIRYDAPKDVIVNRNSRHIRNKNQHSRTSQ